MRKKGAVLTPSTVGEHLRNKRLSLGLRQQDVASQVGTMREVYDRWERDERQPVVSQWPRILRFLGYYPVSRETAADLFLQIRRSHGVDQKKLASIVGVTHQQLRRWEHGQEPIPSEAENKLKFLLDGLCS